MTIWRRGLLVWLLIMGVESLHGTARRLLLPAAGAATSSKPHKPLDIAACCAHAARLFGQLALSPPPLRVDGTPLVAHLDAINVKRAL